MGDHSIAVAFFAYAAEGVDSGASSTSAWVALAVSLVIILFVVRSLYTFASVWKWRSRSNHSLQRLRIGGTDVDIIQYIYTLFRPISLRIPFRITNDVSVHYG